MQGKEHMDYILGLIHKMVNTPVKQSDVSIKQTDAKIPVKAFDVITPEEIKQRIKEREKNKSG